MDLDQSQQFIPSQISQQAQIIQINTPLQQNVPQNDPYGNRKIVPKIPTSYPKMVQPGIYIQPENTSGILVPGKALISLHINKVGSILWSTT